MLFSSWKSTIEIKENVAARSHNPFNQDRTQEVKVARLKGPWHRKIPSYLAANEVRGLELDFGAGFHSTDPSFLAALPFISWFRLPEDMGDGQHRKFEVEGLAGLRHLNAMMRPATSIDFGVFPELASCHMTFQPNLRNFYSAKSLRLLKIYGLKQDASESLLSCENLENLELAHSSLATLAPLRSMKQLKRLSLSVCKKLKHLDGLEELQELRCLQISEVHKLNHLDGIAALKNLEVLTLSDVGEIASVAPLKALTNLKALWISGRSTKVLDGNLLALTELPNLSMLTLVPKRHYSHRAVKQWSWANFENPTTQVERV